jgi:hypothetical protein
MARGVARHAPMLSGFDDHHIDQRVALSERLT